MISYPKELSETKRKELVVSFDVYQKEKAQQQAEAEFKGFIQTYGEPKHLFSVCCEIPVWQQNETSKQWSMFPAIDPTKRRYRTYFYAWSGLLKEVMLLVIFEGSNKQTQRVLS